MSTAETRVVALKLSSTLETSTTPDHLIQNSRVIERYILGVEAAPTVAVAITPEETAALAPSTDKPPTKKLTNETGLAFGKEYGRDALIEMCKAHGAEKVATIAEDKRQAFIEACTNYVAPELPDASDLLGIEEKETEPAVSEVTFDDVIARITELAKANKAADVVKALSDTGVSKATEMSTDQWAPFLALLP